MEEQARRFIVAVTKVTESKQALSLSDAKKYKALHALVMAYLDGERGSLKQQEILQVSVICVCVTRMQGRIVQSCMTHLDAVEICCSICSSMYCMVVPTLLYESVCASQC